MNTNLFIEKIQNGGFDRRFEELYGKNAVEGQKKRYSRALEEFGKLYGEDRDVMLFSVPGRSEVSGNHTDHNRGKVIACAIDLDIIAVASAREDEKIRVKSEGFDEDNCRADEKEPDEKAFFSSGALISGMCAGMKKHGYKAGGFDAYTTSSVLKGSGLSSSAAFEVMIGTIINHLYNEGKAGAPEVARIAQYAENEWFGKPCGLMDQTACAVGGFAYMDFEDPKSAVIEKIPFDLRKAGYSLCITDTKGSHADLNAEYASLPAEMKAVAGEFGQEVLRGLSEKDVLSRAGELREKLGDRAILRAIHFFRENERVEKQVKCLKNEDIEGFFKLVCDSGRSSFCYLQNVYAPKNPREQGLSLALCISDGVLSGSEKPCAFRVHGGGFAGTVQAFVPDENVTDYANAIDSVFGKGACRVLSVRGDGAVRIG